MNVNLISSITPDEYKPAAEFFAGAIIVAKSDQSIWLRTKSFDTLREIDDIVSLRTGISIRVSSTNATFRLIQANENITIGF